MDLHNAINQNESRGGERNVKQKAMHTYNGFSLLLHDACRISCGLFFSGGEVREVWIKLWAISAEKQIELTRDVLSTAQMDRGYKKPFHNFWPLYHV